jgi:hypothetical protein
LEGFWLEQLGKVSDLLRIPLIVNGQTVRS